MLSNLANPQTPESLAKKRGFSKSSLATLVPVLLTVLLRGLVGGRYGPFRDEMYYQACAGNLSWGYVDHPPLSVFLLRIWGGMFSQNEISIRSLSALISVASIVAVCRLTRKLGGTSMAVFLAGLVVFASPVLQVVGVLYSPNTLDLLLWALGVFAWLQTIQHPEHLRWSFVLGLVLGMVCLNRLSGLWLIAALLVGTLIQKRSFFSPKVCALIGIGLVLVLSPYLAWQARLNYPTLEFIKNANAHKLVPVSPLQFFVTQLVVMNPLAAPVWIFGVVVGMKRKEWRGMAVAFLTVVLILLINGKSRENYLSPAYIFVIPIGAIAVVQRLGGKRLELYAATVAASGALLALVCLPILPKETLASILGSLPNPPSTEKGEKSKLQGLADMFGWEEMTRATSAVWRALPADSKAETAIITSNYGEASALLKFGPKLGLPRPICGHNQFWLWGPGGWDGGQAILLGQTDPKILGSFKSVKLISRVDAPWATPEEAKAPIYLASALNCSVTEFWNRAKKFQ